MVFSHKPVMLNECLEGLNIKEDGVYVDCTLGGAGHAAEILRRLGPKGLLIGIDQDREALEAAAEKLKNVDAKGRYITLHSNFENIRQVLETQKIKKLDGILLDLGVSSHQLDTKERGFRYQENAPLDMRMDRSKSFDARELLNTWPKERIAAVISEYGEEKWAVRIAEFISSAREKTEINTTAQLVDIIKAAIPAQARRKGPHPAKRTFQAIRIAVNRELETLKNVLPEAFDMLNAGGRMCVITFHSLEDRIVKQFISERSGRCKCPPGLPKCVCNAVRELKQVTSKPITPSADELKQNHRARSAKLRVIEKF